MHLHMIPCTENIFIYNSLLGQCISLSGSFVYVISKSLSQNTSCAHDFTPGLNNNSSNNNNNNNNNNNDNNNKNNNINNNINNNNNNDNRINKRKNKQNRGSYICDVHTEVGGGVLKFWIVLHLNNSCILHFYGCEEWDRSGTRVGSLFASKAQYNVLLKKIIAIILSLNVATTLCVNFLIKLEKPNFGATLAPFRL